MASERQVHTHCDLKPGTDSLSLTMSTSKADGFKSPSKTTSSEMLHARCIAGRATTCWKAHLKGRPDVALVIKDSWQYPERDEEGDLLCEATAKGVVNIARYYHHETVQIHGTDDDIRSNVRGGLDVTRAANYRPERSMPPSSTTAGAPRKGRSISAASKKRSSSHTGAPLPPSKRSCSASPTKADSNALPNRVHRRVILRDYGKPIYKASSPSALLAGLEGCIKGHESLHEAGFLHRDISINNLMINEDDGNPSWPSFLIDLDLSIKEKRDCSSGKARVEDIVKNKIPQEMFDGEARLEQLCGGTLNEARLSLLHPSAQYEQ
ncbi:hypothetical protein QQZ08_011553 [Neonectria magnoliae]|uniref:non-specific serine/threonine protein kinase n=1 Tax=Neonectria magnoliae TaxID=2732573 RepID=A0ABR1H9Q5_9HYPO